MRYRSLCSLFLVAALLSGLPTVASADSSSGTSFGISLGSEGNGFQFSQQNFSSNVSDDDYGYGYTVGRAHGYPPPRPGFHRGPAHPPHHGFHRGPGPHHRPGFGPGHHHRPGFAGPGHHHRGPGFGPGHHHRGPGFVGSRGPGHRGPGHRGPAGHGPRRHN